MTIEREPSPREIENQSDGTEEGKEEKIEELNDFFDAMEKNSAIDIFHFENQTEVFRQSEKVGDFEYLLCDGLKEFAKAKLAIRIGNEEKATELMGDDYFFHPNFFVRLSSLSPRSEFYVSEGEKSPLSLKNIGIDITEKLANRACDYFRLIFEQRRKAIQEFLPEIWEQYEKIRNAESEAEIVQFFISNSKFAEFEKLNEVLANNPENFQDEYRLKEEIASQFILSCFRSNENLTLGTIKQVRETSLRELADELYEERKLRLEKFFSGKTHVYFE